MMNRTLAILILAAGTLSGASKTTLFKNAVVHTVSGADIQNGQVLVTDGKIAAVGGSTESLAADETIDLQGAHLYPGLINPAGSLGLVEINQVRATRDMAESGEFTPDVKAWQAVDPDSELIAAARANGITHTVVVPTGAMIAGQSGLVQLGAGWTVEDLNAKSPLAMHLFWPSMTLDTTPRDQARDKERWKSLEEQAKERRLRLKEIEDFFAEAEAYAAGSRPNEQKVPAWEAMIPLVRGEIPLVIHADSYRQIKAALKFAEGRKFRMIILGGRDSWKLAKELAAQKVPVIFERVFNDGDGLSSGQIRDTDAYDVHFRAPAILAEAGVKVAVTGGVGGDEAANVRNLPYVAAQAMAFGLPREEALKTISLNVAEMFDCADRLGSIAVGKEATFFVATGDVLDIRSRVEKLWIKGQAVSLENKQTRLWQKYRSRPSPAR